MGLKITPFLADYYLVENRFIAGAMTESGTQNENDLRPGQIVANRYEICGRIGTGGMGTGL